MVTPILLTALSIAISAGCTALAWSHARAVRSATSGEAGDLAIALRRSPPDARLGELARRARPQSWEHRAALEALEAADPRAKIAAVNDALADLDHTFRAGAAWPPTSVRIAISSCLLLALVTWLAASAFTWALAIVGVGVAAALACAEASRSARRSVESQRRAVDDLVAVVLGHLADDQPPPHRRRGAR